MAMDEWLRTYLKEHRADMFDLLRQLVCINSGSYNKSGVDAVGRVIADALADCDLTLDIIETKPFGNPLVFRTPCPSTETGQVLLVGHMDTVFQADTDFRDYREDANRAYGPGVVDMKGGLVAGIFALKALSEAGLLKRLPLSFVLNGDEEIGSKWSRALIRREAKKVPALLSWKAAGSTEKSLSAGRATFRPGSPLPEERGTPLLQAPTKPVRLWSWPIKSWPSRPSTIFPPESWPMWAR